MTRLALPVFQVDAAQTDLATALQLMSGLSRNRFVVEVQDAQAQVLGSVEVKGGIVLQAEAGPLQGREAVRALLQAQPQTLTAFHVQGGTPGEPIESLERLLMEGTVVVDEPHRSSEDRSQEPLSTFPVVSTGEASPTPLPTPAVIPPTPPAPVDAGRPRSVTLLWVLVAGLLVTVALLIGLMR